MTLAQMKERADQIANEKTELERKKNDKVERMQQTLRDLNKVLSDYNQNSVTDKAEGYVATDRKDDDGNELYLQTQNAIADIEYALKYDPELLSWSRQVENLDIEAGHLKNAMGAKTNAGSMSASKASMDSSLLTQEDTLGKIEAAKEGIKADFNGVITAMPATVVDGATVANGSQLFTIANLDDVQVSISVSKSDLPKVSVGEKVDITINGKQYQGEVTKVSGTATKNANGVAVVATIIKVTNPDSDIILGVEANNKIHAQKADDTIVLPYELIQTDSTGDFVYVLENGVVTRKDVTIGISTSTDAQITEGLSVGDQVISSDVSLLTEGMAVVVAQ